MFSSEQMTRHPTSAATVEPTPHAARELDRSTRAAMESAFRHDFSAVRIHADERAAAQGARALTAGNDIHVAPGEYVPGTRDGTHLLAHELAHVVQQGGRAPSGTTPDRSAEPTAHAAADRVAAGDRVAVSPREVSGPQLDDGAKPAAPKKEDDPAEVITGGLKTVADELKKNEKVKKELIEPVTNAAERQWGKLGTGEKVGAVSFGAATLGLAGGSLLSDPAGRKVLSGVNLAAPLGLIPYSTLSTFSYTMPSGKGGESQLWKFQTGFDFSDVLKLAGDKVGGLKGWSLSADLKWSYDPATESLRLDGGTGRIGVGLVPGLSLSGGTYTNLLQPPKLFPTDTGFVESKQSLPEGPKVPGTRDVRVMVTFDFVKFAQSGVVPALANMFGSSKRR